MKPKKSKAIENKMYYWPSSPCSELDSISPFCTSPQLDRYELVKFPFNRYRIDLICQSVQLQIFIRSYSAQNNFPVGYTMVNPRVDLNLTRLSKLSSE